MNIIKKVPVRKESESKLPSWGVFGRHPVLDLQRDISRVFGDFFPGFSLAPVSRAIPGAFMPKVNVTEDSKEVKVSAEGKGYYYLERSAGAFHRDIALPEGIDLDKAEAVFRKGVLTVTLPKRPDEQEERKKIAVKQE
ncbi:MAG: Hsp20/alpha crystallin family protein [Lentisphaerae bacterium]|nr:Hsp20/alpha crystallin family protein [Lentisphaerota bacterium]